MKSLPTLIKLANQKVNNQRLRLAEFEKKDQELSATMETLRGNLNFEEDRARDNPLLAADYGRYAQQVDQQIADIMLKYEENKTRLNREQDRLALLFKDQKVLEIYQEQQHKKALQEKEGKLQNQMDEIAARLARVN